jgi:hypothetical protein
MSTVQILRSIFVLQYAGLHFVIAFNIMPQRQESSNCVDATYQICDAGDLVIMQHTSEV